MLLILGWFFYVLLPYGPAVTFDSVSFLEAGNHFWAGEGFMHTGSNGPEFAAHRFPLYPIILSLFDGSNSSLIALQVLIFAGSLFLYYQVLKLLKAPTVFLFLFAFMMVLLNYYCLWTESLYGLLFIGLLFVLVRQQSDQLLWVVLILSLLCLTRMVGLVVGGSLFLSYLLSKNKRNAWTVLFSSLVVIGSWTALGTVYLGQTARSIEWHPIDGIDVLHLLEAIGSFFVPPTEYPSIRMFVGIILLTLPIIKLLIQLKKRGDRNVFQWFLHTHLLAYPVFLLISKSMIDVSIPFEFRTLLPYYLTYACWIATIFSGDDKIKNRLSVALITPFLVWNLFSVKEIKNQGLGYNSSYWESHDFEPLKSYQKQFVITNDQAACIYWMEPKATVHVLAEKQNLYSGLINELYQEELDAQLSLIDHQNGLIVWFRNGITAAIYLSEQELRDPGRFELLHDGGIYLLARPLP